MKFNGNIIELGKVNLSNMDEWVTSQSPEEWDRINFRQTAYKTHVNTESIFILYNERGLQEKNDEFLTTYFNELKAIHKTVEEKLNKNLKVKRIIIPKLKQYGFIKRHVDSGPFLTTHWRCHFPIVTNDNVIFFVGNQEINMKANHGYIINNQRRHGVSNNSPFDRYHLIMDFGEK